MCAYGIYCVNVNLLTLSAYHSEKSLKMSIGKILRINPPEKIVSFATLHNIMPAKVVNWKGKKRTVRFVNKFFFSFRRPTR